METSRRFTDGFRLGFPKRIDLHETKALRPVVRRSSNRRPSGRRLGDERRLTSCFFASSPSFHGPVIARYFGSSGFGKSTVKVSFQGLVERDLVVES